MAATTWDAAAVGAGPGGVTFLSLALVAAGGALGSLLRRGTSAAMSAQTPGLPGRPSGELLGSF